MKLFRGLLQGLPMGYIRTVMQTVSLHHEFKKEGRTDAVPEEGNT